MSVCQSVFDIQLLCIVRLVPFLAPVMTLMANRCTFSSLSLSSFVQLPHTMSPYSSSGRMKDVYSFSRLLQSSFSFKFLRMSTLLVAFLIMELICSDHLPSCCRILPRCFWLFTFSMRVPFIFTCWRSSSCLREKFRLSVLVGLNFTCHLVAQFVTSSRFRSISVAAVCLSRLDMNMLTSSAYNLTSVVMLSVRSFI